MLRACIIMWAAMFIAGSNHIDWGFFGHRLINKMAVFTLPPELIPLYKEHIDYISAHAVDPDKRRYATRHEGSRHYIDLDHWGTYPFDTLPREWISALGELLEYHCIGPAGDTVLLKIESEGKGEKRQWIYRQILPQYYEEKRSVDCDSLVAYFVNVECVNCLEVLVSEELSDHGILPYHLVKAQRNLTEAFRQGNIARVLSLSADIGHYIADAHVPLHTTENYNGQLSGQKGIHAFWESRIPELFAHQYDFFTGRARYIDNPLEYYWNIVLHSNSLVDSVLFIEKQVSEETPSDKQYCFDQRGETIVRSQCAEYAGAYSLAMQNMVERQMRAAVHAVGSAWLTAWIDAGQPRLLPTDLVESEDARSVLRKIENDYRLGKIKGRAH
jgi:hypothetical protein